MGAQHRILGGLIHFAKRRPLATNVILSTTSAVGADFVEQRRSHDATKPWLDIDRSLTFFGFSCFNGIILYFVYVTFLSKIFPGAASFASQSWGQKMIDRAGQKIVMKQCAFDLFVFTPLVYFPIFYTFKSTCQAQQTVSMGDTVSEAVDNYRKNWVWDNLLNWGIWGPGDVAIFAVPMWMRMPVCHSITFFWNMHLSRFRGPRNLDPVDDVLVSLS